MRLAACVLFLSVAATSAATPAWLGFVEGPARPTPALAQLGHAATRQAVRIVLPDGPADRAGLKNGDVLLEIDGRPVDDEKALTAALDGLKAGQTIRMTVQHGERRVEATATAQDRPEPPALLAALRQLGEAGRPGAFTALAHLLCKGGHGVAKDDAEAVRWLRKAAEQGNAAGQCNLGSMVEHGWGVAKDDVEAVRLFRLAADQGYAEAEYCLGVMYLSGEGVARHALTAAYWFRLAAEQGHPLAQRLLTAEPAH